MSKSNLRREYEARMGVVEGYLRLFNSKGQAVYCEEPGGHWSRYEYNETDKQHYYENSSGVIRDNRLPKAKIFTDENGTQYKLVELVG